MIHKEAWFRKAALDRDIEDAKRSVEESLRRQWVLFQRTRGQGFPKNWFEGHAHVLGHYGLLANSDFRFLDYRYGPLSNSAFYRRDLHGSNFEGMNEVTFNFYGSNLKSANFNNVVFSFANFHSTNLKNATFRGADLSKISHFNRALFDNTDLRGATLPAGPDGVSLTQLPGIIL